MTRDERGNDFRDRCGHTYHVRRPITPDAIQRAAGNLQAPPWPQIVEDVQLAISRDSTMEDHARAREATVVVSTLYLWGYLDRTTAES